MANRRMIAKSIVNTDSFCEMPEKVQLLYFRFIFEADDDGFVINPKQIMRMLGNKDTDLQKLIDRNYIIFFQSGVIVITHWLIHNTIRKDRYKQTSCVEERQLLDKNEKEEYFLRDLADMSNDTEWLSNGQPNDNQMETQVKLSKVKLSKDKLGECKYTLGHESISYESYQSLVEKYGETLVVKEIERIIRHPYYGCLNEETVDQWCREAQETFKNQKAEVKNKNINMKGRDYSKEDWESLQQSLVEASLDSEKTG